MTQNHRPTIAKGRHGQALWASDRGSDRAGEAQANSLKRLREHKTVHVRHADEAYQDLRKAHVGANEDEKAIDRLDPDGKIRAAVEARVKIHPPVATGTDTKK